MEPWDHTQALENDIIVYMKRSITDVLAGREDEFVGHITDFGQGDPAFHGPEM
jgi:hypothetical protein